jgi:hypothetical protein
VQNDVLHVTMFNRLLVAELVAYGRADYSSRNSMRNHQVQTAKFPWTRAGMKPAPSM